MPTDFQLVQQSFSRSGFLSLLHTDARVWNEEQLDQAELFVDGCGRKITFDRGTQAPLFVAREYKLTRSRRSTTLENLSTLFLASRAIHECRTSSKPGRIKARIWNVDTVHFRATQIDPALLRSVFHHPTLAHTPIHLPTQITLLKFSVPLPCRRSTPSNVIRYNHHDFSRRGPTWRG